MMMSSARGKVGGWGLAREVFTLFTDLVIYCCTSSSSSSSGGTAATAAGGGGIHHYCLIVLSSFYLCFWLCGSLMDYLHD